QRPEQQGRGKDPPSVQCSGPAAPEGASGLNLSPPAFLFMKTRASVALMWLLGFAGLGAENDFISVPPIFTGNWSWNFTMPDRTAVRPKVKLVQDGDKVTGTSSLRPGTEIAITNGVLQDKVVTFEV